MKASRLLSLPPYLFEDLENRYQQSVANGSDVIDLSIGDPDLRPPDSLILNLKTALDDESHHRYPPQRGDLSFKASIRQYLSRRCGIEPANDQILVLIGSKEGLAHLPLAICNPGDTAIVPDPGYPVYHSSATFAGCNVSRVTLAESNAFRPDRSQLSRVCEGGARLLLLNYPNNPTSATAAENLFADALELSERYGVVVANDAAYADVYTGDRVTALLCGEKDALERRAIEFFSFSKMYSITGWRVGFAVGHRDIIGALGHLKANIDSGAFGAIQEAVGATLDGDGDAYCEQMRRRYEERRETAGQLLDRLGFHCFSSCATFYLWVRVPSAQQSMDFAIHLLDRADVLVTPGVGFGAGGEGYFRIALTQPIDRIEEAIHRLAKL
jgi:LL-diaminopimelate aminotransferase